MMKNVITVIESCLLALLVTSSISSFVPLGNARSSFSLGSTFNVPAYEVSLGSAVAKFIKTLATLRQWEHAQNYFGAGTTVIRTCICAGGDGDTYAISFNIGHGYFGWYQNGEHYWIIDNNGDPTYDYVLYSYTSQRRTRFALIWSCYQARERGGSYDGSQYGPHGMPNAWLHTANLSPDGYSSPWPRGYAFIGWSWRAPFLEWNIEADEAGYNFLLNFYAYALYDQEILITSLDDASLAVWGCVFDGCPFRLDGVHFDDGTSYLRLYGDGLLQLP